MRLIEALEINNQRRASGAPPLDCSLACGFMPLHLATFFEARLNLAFPDRAAVIDTGLYGDLTGNIERALERRPGGIAIVIEWQDLDSRLGIRQLGGWTPKAAEDILANTAKVLDRLGSAVCGSDYRGTIAICPPTLPLPPFSHEPAWQSGLAELALRHHLSCFLMRIARLGNLRILSADAIDWISPAAGRFDVQSEIGAGFPYKIGHADAVAQLLARIIHNRSPKKGLITDLDDTLWRGILGDTGPREVCWDLANKAQIHGVYQQFLMALASRGVLLAVVSKNDPALVEQAFAREDIVLSKSSIFPIEAGWGRKSEAVARVLKAWNIAADSVIFVDDSPMELEEVKRAHPEIETRLFPPRDPAAAWRLIAELQDHFGKPEIGEEDHFRLASLRDAARFAERAAEAGNSGPSEDAFLAEVEAAITIETRPEAVTARALELINKTNQFNLNGRRLTEAEWAAQLADPAGFLQVVSYQDKFGQLGIIAVLSGRMQGELPHVTSWVMSCRAFSRRIEFQCLRALFERTGADEIWIEYQPTPRNQLLREFLAIFVRDFGSGPVRIQRQQFLDRCPSLFHSVSIR